MSNNTSKALRLKNKYLLGLVQWLSNLVLYGKESRERSRFIKVLSEPIREVEKERIDLLTKYTDKDDKGNIKTKKDIQGRDIYDIPDEKMIEFQKEYNELMEEELVLDVLESNKYNIQAIKNILLEPDYKFGPREGDSPVEKEMRMKQAGEYDAWCEAFEKVEL